MTTARTLLLAHVLSNSDIALRQILEEESQWEEAIKQYQSSADYYSAENAPTTALKAMAKVAELSVKASDVLGCCLLFEVDCTPPPPHTRQLSLTFFLLCAA